jgi:chaperone BCS1
MKITISNSQKNNLFKILYYSSFILSKNNIDHDKLIFHFLDKKLRIYKYHSTEQIDQILYIINPQSGPYDLFYQDHKLRLEFQILDNDNLYPYIEKDVFEFVFHLDIFCDSEQIIENFIKDAIHYASKVLNIENPTKNYIYQFNDVELNWDNFGEISKRDINTIYLPKEQSSHVLQDVEHFMSIATRKNYEKFGIPYHKTYCFYGPPGTGKTSLIHAICSEIHRHICIFRFHNSSKDSDFANALKWMPKNSVFVLEDIDCIMKNRDDTKGNITFSGILNILDGFCGIDCLITFITTNHFLELDAAIKRPGRIDYILEFTFISKEQIYKMFRVFYPDEFQDYDDVYNQIKNYKMTVCHLQKFLFSLYPDGQIKKNVNLFVQEFLKYYTLQDSKLYI